MQLDEARQKENAKMDAHLWMLRQTANSEGRLFLHGSAAYKGAHSAANIVHEENMRAKEASEKAGRIAVAGDEPELTADQRARNMAWSLEDPPVMQSYNYIGDYTHYQVVHSTDVTDDTRHLISYPGNGAFWELQPVGKQTADEQKAPMQKYAAKRRRQLQTRTRPGLWSLSFR
jgi:hypothetical protein